MAFFSRRDRLAAYLRQVIGQMGFECEDCGEGTIFPYRYISQETVRVPNGTYIRTTTGDLHVICDDCLRKRGDAAVRAASSRSAPADG